MVSGKKKTYSMNSNLLSGENRAKQYVLDLNLILWAPQVLLGPTKENKVLKIASQIVNHLQKITVKVVDSWPAGESLSLG